MTHHLKFETEKGASRSKWVAGLMVLLIVGWMGSGAVIPSEEPEAPKRSVQDEVKPVTVATRPSQAENVTDVVIAEGQAEAERDTTIRAETGGTIAEVLVAKGADVAGGQVIARIDAAQRSADLARTEAELARAQRELDNAQALLERGVATTDRVAQARAARAAAEAGLANATEAMRNLDITAPFAGRIEALGIQPGEFISPGAQAGRIVDLDPLTVSVQVPQQVVGALKVGQTAEVNFITGVVRNGMVAFVGTSASPSTRTFEVEITIENPGAQIPAGLSAEVRIPTGQSNAHFLSPAILSLDTSGTLGVKAVGEENRVVFYPVEIIRAQTDGVWVTGLPDALTLITIGQGFVNDGEVVDPKSADLLATTARKVSQ